MQIFLLDIIKWLEAHQLPCLFKELTRFDCPGCGLQRSLLLLIRGDIQGSFTMYPALIPIILLLAFLILHVIKNIRGGTVILKYSYLFCAGIILLGYFYKLIIT